MDRKTLISLFCLISANCFAIDFYAPGDSVWVWAKSGLNIRELPNDRSKILGKAVYGSQIITLEYQDRNSPYEIEEIKKHITTNIHSEKTYHPNFEITGYWAKVNYKGITGYVFDAYLSKLPAFKYREYEKQQEEDFHALSIRKYAKILKQTGQNRYDENDHKFVRYIFDNGCVIEISGESGGWQKQMLFSGNMSLIEGYLIYSNTMKSETDSLLEKGEDYLIFEIESGSLVIKKVGSFLILYEKHSC